MRKMALYLWESNPLANRLIEMPLAYLLAEGVRLTCKDEDNQKLLDRFWKDPINSMSMKLPKKVRELSIYGEQCYPTFVNEIDGFVRLGYLDPSLIETVVKDPDNPEQPIGIVTCKNKKGVAKRYRVIVNGPEDVFTQRTQEDPRDLRRRRGVLLHGERPLERLPRPLRSPRADRLARRLRRVPLRRARPLEVHARLHLGRDAEGRDRGRCDQEARRDHHAGAGLVRVHNDSEEWSRGAGSEGDRLRRGRAPLPQPHPGRRTMPEHWFGGGGDVNRAAAAEMGEPTFKIYTMRQLMVKFMLEEIGSYVLRKAALAAKAGPSSTRPTRRTSSPRIPGDDRARHDGLRHGVAAARRGLRLRDRQGPHHELTAVRLIGAIAQRLGMKIDAEKELARGDQELEARRSEGADAAIPPLPGTGEPRGSPASLPALRHSPPRAPRRSDDRAVTESERQKAFEREQRRLLRAQIELLRNTQAEIERLMTRRSPTCARSWPGSPPTISAGTCRRSGGDPARARGIPRAGDGRRHDGRAAIARGMAAATWSTSRSPRPACTWPAWRRSSRRTSCGAEELHDRSHPRRERRGHQPRQHAARPRDDRRADALRGDEGGRGILEDNSLKRATTIVRTELGRAFSVASQARMDQAAKVVNRWTRSGGDPESRTSAGARDRRRPARGARRAVRDHREDGRDREAHVPARSEGPPGETINCGCVAIPKVRGWSSTTPDQRAVHRARARRQPRAARKIAAARSRK
jgi:hypothetical protein